MIDKLFRLNVLRGRHCLDQVVKRILHANHIDVGRLLQNLAHIKIVGFLQHRGVLNLGIFGQRPIGKLAIVTRPMNAANIPIDVNAMIENCGGFSPDGLT